MHAEGDTHKVQERTECVPEERREKTRRREDEKREKTRKENIHLINVNTNWYEHSKRNPKYSVIAQGGWVHRTCLH
jgi:hypothetical protein